MVGTPQSFEIYGCMLRKGDPAFKKAVDDALVATFKSAKINAIYDKWFLQPIPPKNLNLNFPISAELKRLIAEPTDKSAEEREPCHWSDRPWITTGLGIFFKPTGIGDDLPGLVPHRPRLDRGAGPSGWRRPGAGSLLLGVLRTLPGRILLPGIAGAYAGALSQRAAPGAACPSGTSWCRICRAAAGLVQAG